MSQALIRILACAVAVVALTAWTTWARAAPPLVFEDFTREEFLRIREDDRLASDRAALEGLAQQVESLPSSPTRTEALLFLGEAFARRLGDPRRGALEWQRLASDAGADPLSRRYAATQAVDVLCLAGDLKTAQHLADEFVVVDASLRFPRLERALRRIWMRWISAAILFATALAFGIALVRNFRRSRREELIRLRRVLPLAGTSTILIALGGVLAHVFQPGSGAPFFLLALALFPLPILASTWSGERPSALHRLTGAILFAGSALAISILVLDSVDPKYLEGFGL